MAISGREMGGVVGLNDWNGLGSINDSNKQRTFGDLQHLVDTLDLSNPVDLQHLEDLKRRLESNHFSQQQLDPMDRQHVEDLNRQLRNNTTGYNLGQIFVNACVQAQDLAHVRLSSYLEELEKHEEISKQLQVLLNLFGKAKGNDSADFSTNAEFLAAVSRIKELDSSVVEGLLGHAADTDYHWKTKEDLEALWQGCNSAMRLQTSHVEKVMMRISQLYQDRTDLFDTGSKAIKDDNDLKQRILSQRG